MQRYQLPNNKHQKNEPSKNLLDQVERFYELKNRVTNLILRYIIFREEKIILSNSKKFIRKLLKMESNTKTLLHEEELKKCIKPLLAIEAATQGDSCEGE